MPNSQRLDPYVVLGVARDASPLQVARAHRRLAKRYHPDRPDGDAEQMRRINEAWHILSAPWRRSEYDHAHPSAGTPSSGHWAATRRSFRASPPSSTRTWASWRATATETRAAPRTMRQPGEVHIPATRRPPPIRPQRASFRDSAWAAVAAAAVFIAILATAIAFGRLF